MPTCLSTTKVASRSQTLVSPRRSKIVRDVDSDDPVRTADEGLLSILLLTSL